MIGSADVTCSSATFGSHVGELGLGVLATYYGHGLGRALTSTVMSAAASSNTINFLLRVRTFNEPAIRLYEQLGFMRVGTLVEVARLPEGFVDEHVYQRVVR